jgi:hypothetical protein
MTTLNTYSGLPVLRDPDGDLQADNLYVSKRTGRQGIADTPVTEAVTTAGTPQQIEGFTAGFSDGVTVGTDSLTIVEPGDYRFFFNGSVANTTGVRYAEVRPAKNGTVVAKTGTNSGASGFIDQAATAGNVHQPVAIDTILADLQVGDVITLYGDVETDGDTISVRNAEWGVELHRSNKVLTSQ